MPAAQDRHRFAWRYVLLGAALGAGAIAGVLGLCAQPFEEVEENFPVADATTIAAWTKQFHVRADRWLDVPDPPGVGPVETARYWLSHWSYDMEVRRRGEHFVVAVAGVAPHIHGGGWSAYGVGRIRGPARGFGGTVATFTWSCLGVRYRHASDGVGRLLFDGDGRGVAAWYMAYEAPLLWAKAYGRQRGPDEEAPAYGTIRGEIPITPALARLEEAATYRVGVHVVDEAARPIAGAIVQLKGRDATRQVTDDQGRCEVAFRGRDAPYAQVLAAACDGYHNGEWAAFAGDEDPAWRAGGLAPQPVRVVLERLDATDHPDYVWNHPSAAADPDDVMACGTCHPWQHDEWFESRHARMADSGRVLWERERMVAADPDAPDDCCGCHQPAAALDEPDLRFAPRGPLAGNHCDFCHKIRAVKQVGASGVYGAYEIVRPDPGAGRRPGGIGHVFGSAPDSTFAYMGAVYSSLFGASHLCAGCHQGGGRVAAGSPPKIDTYEEWSRWVAAQAPEDARTCQQCHMPAATTISDEGRALDQLAWDGLHRTPEHLHSHRFPGTEAAYAMEALDVRVDKRRDFDAGVWVVRVSVTNKGAGHKIPTGTWSKRVIVGVWATLDGTPLLQVGGDRTWLDPTAPEGVAFAPGDWRNPGGFVLGVRARSDPEGRQGEPPFWMPWPEEEILDRRLAPGETRTATCRFKARLDGGVPEVEVRVLHRRGRLPQGLASVPWTVRPYDAPPEVLWARVRR